MAMITYIIDWVLQYQAELIWLGLFSISTFLLGLFLMRQVIVRLPDDYFLKSKVMDRTNDRSGMKIFVFVFKNVTGGLLLCVGLLMLFLPGPGLLVLSIGLVLADIPGKRRVIVRLLRIANTRQAINNYRGRQGIVPFKFED